ncbi:MAG: Slp/YeaY family lipoprotein [Pseudomonadota bacterium]
MRRYLFASLALLLLSACATVPAPIAGGPFLPITAKLAQEQNVVGERVRWGGIILSTTTGKQETCFEVLSRPLDSIGQPWRTDKTDGRFVGCTPEFHDPAIYAPGREITMVGTLQAPLVCKVGEYEYRCASLRVESLYLWPLRDNYGVPYYYDPFWDPYRYPYYRYR